MYIAILNDVELESIFHIYMYAIHTCFQYYYHFWSCSPLIYLEFHDKIRKGLYAILLVMILHIGYSTFPKAISMYVFYLKTLMEFSLTKFSLDFINLSVVIFWPYGNSNLQLK